MCGHGDFFCHRSLAFPGASQALGWVDHWENGEATRATAVGMPVSEHFCDVAGWRGLWMCQGSGDVQCWGCLAFWGPSWEHVQGQEAHLIPAPHMCLLLPSEYSIRWLPQGCQGTWARLLIGAPPPPHPPAGKLHQRWAGPGAVGGAVAYGLPWASRYSMKSWACMPHRGGDQWGEDVIEPRHASA